MIRIVEIDSVYLRIECERGIAKELSSYFTFRVPNFQYTPAFKNRLWDGKIRLFNMINGYLYRGLLDHLLLFFRERNYSAEYYPKYNNNIPSDKELEVFINDLPLYSNTKEIQLHDHQQLAIKQALTNKRILLLSPTGSGKSLIIYCLLQYLLSRIPSDKKILIIVPNTGLVAQMLHDFRDYSGSSENPYHAIYSGQSKETTKKIVVSTWQSLYKEPEAYFSQFGAVFGDECHLFKAKSLTSIMTKLKDCPYRIGTTGTLDGTDTHRLVIEGLFGGVFSVTTTKELIDSDLLSKLKIECLILQYSLKDIEQIKKAKYQEEIDWLISNDKRNKFISGLAKSTKGNTLVLFNYVEKHGIPLFESLKSSDKKVYLIYGGTDIEDREKIRQILNSEENCILVASYGTCSTGINIKNIKNIIFSSPSKSVIRILQSIGRGLRKAENKNEVTVYDIGDDLHWKRYRNHALRHLDERILIYNREKFIHNRRFIRLGGL